MTDKTQNTIFSNNLNHLLIKNKKTQKEVADAIGVSPQTFNTWCMGIALPRMGKIQKLADYFSVTKSELIDAPSTFGGEDHTRAIEMYKHFQEATPEVRSAIETLLKLRRPDS